MDKVFAAHRDYLDNQENESCLLLRHSLIWSAPRRLDTIEYIDDVPDTLDAFKLDDTVPVGDLRFVQRWLEKTGCAVDGHMTPLEVPACLIDFMSREYFTCVGRNIPEKYLDGSRYFLKDIDTLKKWNSLLYDGELAGFIEEDTRYSISEKVVFLSEWRTFVHEDVEQGCFNYLGDPMMFPDREAIHDMVCALRESGVRPRSYTLDVGIVAGIDGKRRTEPIEIHPFVACGLYGFSSPVLANMLCGGYEWYYKDANANLDERQ